MADPSRSCPGRGSTEIRGSTPCKAGKSSVFTDEGSDCACACEVPVGARMTRRTLDRLQRIAEMGLGAKPRMIALLVLALAFAASVPNASPLSQGQVEVVDGDTIRIAGETFRLVGFDAPETYRARCPSERELGNRATFRLRQLVAGGGLDLERVACSCASGTEGTRRCNYGRSCGT